MNKDSLQPDSEDEFDEELPPWFKALILPKPWMEDRYAPEVDRDLLRRLARKEPSRDQFRAVYMLIEAFGCWRDAWRDIIVEEFHKRFPPSASLQQ